MPVDHLHVWTWPSRNIDASLVSQSHDFINIPDTGEIHFTICVIQLVIFELHGYILPTCLVVPAMESPMEVHLRNVISV